MAKKCNTCDIEQDSSQFYKDSSLPGGLKHRCKLCTRTYNSKIYKNTNHKRKACVVAWKARNPDYVRNNSLETKYGLSLEAYNLQLEKQNHSCAICNKHKTENAGGKNLAVDHSHITGKVRGLLCYHCNLAIGMLKDSKSNALRAAEYLELYEKESAL